MNHSWRTKNVVAICQAMRETDDYSACPVLADALDDAGCDDVDLLSSLRSFRDTCRLQRLVAIVYSKETEEAVRQIEKFAESLGCRAFSEEGDDYGERVPVTYERLMRVGDRWTNSSSQWIDYTTERGSDDLRDGGMYDFDKLWSAYRAITGRQGSGNPFSCTC